MPIELPDAKPKHANCEIEFIDLRPYPNDEGIRVGFNGYAEMVLRGDRLSVNYNDLDGHTVYAEAWTTDGGNLVRNTYGAKTG